MSLHNRASLEPYLLDEIRFYQHQVEGVAKMSEMRSVLLADEMGLGKSLQTLAVFAIDLIKGLSRRMIVVAPSSLKVNWHEETQKFTRVHSEILSGPAKKRSATLERFAGLPDPKILIVNYEQVKAHLRELNAIEFDIAAFDEAHMLKNPTAQRTAACMQLVSQRSIMLTGSPVLNHVNELWVMLNRISPGDWGSYHAFVGRYCVYGGYEGRSIVATKNEKELTERLQAVMVRRLKKDVLDLPAVQYITKYCELTPRQRKFYTEVKEDLKLSIEGAESQDVEASITKFLRLKQICGTTAALPNAVDDHSHKLDMAAEDAKQLLAGGHRVIAFTQFRAVQDAYHRRIRGSGAALTDYPVYIINGDTPTEPDGKDPSDPTKKWCRQEIVNGWAQNPQAGIIIATFGSAGVGLNMTAARHGQFLDKLYVPSLNQQAVDRMHRIGASTTQPIQVLEYICKKTVEDQVEKILKAKKKVIGSVVEGQAGMSMAMLRQILAAEEEDERKAA